MSCNAFKAGKQSFQHSSKYMNDMTCMNEMQHGISWVSPAFLEGGARVGQGGAI